MTRTIALLEPSGDDTALTICTAEWKKYKAQKQAAVANKQKMVATFFSLEILVPAIFGTISELSGKILRQRRLGFVAQYRHMAIVLVRQAQHHTISGKAGDLLTREFEPQPMHR